MANRKGSRSAMKLGAQQKVARRLNPSIGRQAGSYDHQQYALATFKGRGGPATPSTLKN